MAVVMVDRSENGWSESCCRGFIFKQNMLTTFKLDPTGQNHPLVVMESVFIVELLIYSGNRLSDTLNRPEFNMRECVSNFHD